MASILGAAVLVPLLGGPRITLPSAHSLRIALRDGAAWGCVSLLVALLLSRTRAAWRSLRGRRARSSPFRAAGRTLLQMIPPALSVFGGMVLLRLLMPTFVGFKRAVAVFHPFGYWDAVLERADRTLHMGVDPWRILQPVVGRPWLTASIDAIYVWWYIVTIAGFVGLVFWLRGLQRGRFLLAFASAWLLLGIFLATGLSAVGPCFFDLLYGGESTFTAQLAYLSSVNETYPLRALELQEGLWRAYLDGSAGLVSGIAAMPSMHVAMPTLFAVAAWHRSRLLSVAFGVYAAVILVGSVHLAWHYALDGYVSIALIFPIWWIAGRVSAWWYARTRSWRWGWREARPRSTSIPVRA